MAKSKHHPEWLNLIDVSGPFLSVPVLERVFPQELDAHDPGHYRTLKLAHEEWRESQARPRPDVATHREWVRFVLQETLALPPAVLVEGQGIPTTLRASMAEHRETLVPDWLVRNPPGDAAAGKPRMLVQVYPASQPLDRPIPGKHWKASPATRMTELARATDVRLGLVTNGEQWMLVDAPRGGTTGFASWYASTWFDEHVTLRAFRSLLQASRFFGVPANETLEAMLEESATNQQEVTDRLGYQVRRAVEVLIQSLDRADQDQKRQLLDGVTEPVLYEAALTVMMRLVFLFSAEERGLLLLGDPLYDENYAVSTLVAQLQEAADNHGEERLERFRDAWVRLLSTFRAVYAGVEHERMKLMAYSGKLFDPDRFPFLEGRKAGTKWRDTPAAPLPINNRTVLHLLRSLQYLELHGEARRLSFQGLDVEQIGHVYEGLLDHTARRATEPTVGLKGPKGSEPELGIYEIAMRARKGKQEVVSYLSEATGKPASSLAKALDKPVDGDEAKRLRATCGNDEALYELVLPVVKLLREDTFGAPVVIPKGSVFVTSGTDRRSSGTHYTPRSLTEPIVRYALEPLVYVGPAEGLPKEEWKLRSASELLDLKVCDMACGSGAFLVQACRYLSERLVEAWGEAEVQNPSVLGILPDGRPAGGATSEQPIPRDEHERVTLARRFVAERCLYGVDKNPLAVEMAKLSLWLITLHKGQPFTFLDHSIKAGDSLLGLTDIRQLENFHMDPKRGAELHEGVLDVRPMVRQVMERVTELRRKLESFTVRDGRDTEAKERLHREVEAALSGVRVLADIVVGVGLATAGKGEAAYDAEIQQWARRVGPGLKEAADRKEPWVASEQLKTEVKRLLDKGLPAAKPSRQTMHWAVEFPEVLAAGGFHAVVGNPPFQGGRKISGPLGTDYREYLVEFLGRGCRGGNGDLCAYFFLQVDSLLTKDGTFGLLATNTIAQGDTRELGLDQLSESGLVITRAVPSLKWPGIANLEVSQVWGARGHWAGECVLAGASVPSISTALTPPGGVQGRPHRLAANAGKSFQGSIVLGMGFVLEPEEALRLIEKDPRNRDVLFPYLNGEDLNSRPDQSPSRWVINFHDWPLERAEEYPDCMRIVREKVMPERQRLRPDGTYQLRKPLPQRWWHYADKRPALYERVAMMNRVLVVCQTSKYHNFAMVNNGIVFGHKLVVFAQTDIGYLGVLQSSFHREWVFQYGSSLETRPVYTPSDCFETYPFPEFRAAEDDPISKMSDLFERDRKEFLFARGCGFTDGYNLLHQPLELSQDTQNLRANHVRLDQQVASAYGWTDLDLGHGFHETKQGTRFTISEPARREVLDRLLALNHERYAEEVKQGLHDKKPRSSGSAKPRAKRSAAPASSAQPALFPASHVPLSDDGSSGAEPDPGDEPDV